MTAIVEHANLTVSELDRTLEFLRIAVPEWRVRGEGFSDRRWLHYGDERSYLALEQARGRTELQAETYVDVGVNHIGLVVDDADAVWDRLVAAGYEPNMKAEPHPGRKRVYLFDPDGIEWEFVEYLSQDPALRNEYSG